MTFHTRARAKVPQGCPINPTKRRSALRVMVSLDDVQFHRMNWLARKRKTTLAAVARDAIYAYTLCIAPEADVERDLW